MAPFLRLKEERHPRKSPGLRDKTPGAPTARPSANDHTRTQVPPSRCRNFHMALFRPRALVPQAKREFRFRRLALHTKRSLISPDPEASKHCKSAASKQKRRREQVLAPLTSLRLPFPAQAAPWSKLHRQRLRTQRLHQPLVRGALFRIQGHARPDREGHKGGI